MGTGEGGCRSIGCVVECKGMGLVNIVSENISGEFVVVAAHAGLLMQTVYDAFARISYFCTVLNL